MLPRHRRLHADRDIRRLLQRGARRRDTLMQLVAAPSPVSFSRAAVVVSKQVFKKATDRNRLRRIIQAQLPKLLEATNPPTDILVRLLPAAAKVKPVDISRSLLSLWPIHGVSQNNPKPYSRRSAAVSKNPFPRP